MCANSHRLTVSAESEGTSELVELLRVRALDVVVLFPGSAVAREEVHGTGANMDNLETHDERKIIPGTCFSVEPGVYLPDFGIRSEVNVFVGSKEARTTGEVRLA